MRFTGTDRDIDGKGAVTFVAHNASSTNTVADASGVGGKDSGSANDAGVKNQGDTTASTLTSNAKAAGPWTSCRSNRSARSSTRPARRARR